MKKITLILITGLMLTLLSAYSAELRDNTLPGEKNFNIGNIQPYSNYKAPDMNRDYSKYYTKQMNDIKTELIKEVSNLPEKKLSEIKMIYYRRMIDFKAKGDFVNAGFYNELISIVAREIRERK